MNDVRDFSDIIFTLMLK